MSESLSAPGRFSSKCPLCAHSGARLIDQHAGEELRKLWRAIGREFSPPAWDSIGPDCVVRLLRCEVCGFQFFEPRPAGNETFYRELEHADYFTENRPEFGRTLRFVRSRGLRRVLDVGCGSGIFLDRARESGCQTCGVELNGAAAERARAKGHTVFNRLLGELTREQTEGGFDLITLFQVLEHVPSPATLLREAAVLLNPGGYLSVAVPSAEGVLRLAPWDPHQWPPHHLSRWRPADFKMLSHATQLRLVKSGGDRLLGSEISHFWNLHNRLAPVLERPTRRGAGCLRTLAFLYRKTGMKFVGPRWGSSIYAYFCS